LGNEGRTEAGDVQVMSAGTGIRHAEYNREDGPTTLFQIWIQPRSRGILPRWAQRRFPKGDRAGQLIILASGRAGDDDALPIDQDAALFGATLEPGQKVTHALGKGRQAYLVGATGAFTVNGAKAKARDGVIVRDDDAVVIQAQEPTEILLADVG
jgi:redox-sensitive bicupin YhaK (pirin superfamily)